MSAGDPFPTLPARDPSGHKGTFGTVAIVGASAGSTIASGSFDAGSLSDPGSTEPNAPASPRATDPRSGSVSSATHSPRATDPRSGSVSSTAHSPRATDPRSGSVSSAAQSPRATDPRSGSVSSTAHPAHTTLRPRMIGGPALSAIAAFRAGAGLVRLVMPAPVLDTGLLIAPSATGLAIPTDAHAAILPHEGARVIDELTESADCLAIGPGLGAADAGAGAMCLRAAQQERIPVVFDADALNNLADIPELRRDFRAAAVLTPHPGEFRRLARSLGLGAHGELDPGGSLDPTNDATRPGAAAALARTLGAIVILKGARAVVSDAMRTWVNDGENSGAATPALATAGSGDVLTGLLAALIAWLHPRRDVRNRALLTDLAARALAAKGSRLAHTSPDTAGHAADAPTPSFSLFDCARLAVRAHALAAALWSERHSGATGGMLAAELADLLPEALESMRR